jgi:Putative transposase
MFSPHQTFGEFAAWHPHWHAIVLEGGFDSHDRFFFIPLGANEALSEIWRRRAVALFLSKGLLNPDFARKLTQLEALRLFYRKRNTHLRAGSTTGVEPIHRAPPAFTGEDALKDVAFSLPQGYIMGLVGENGAGKTETRDCSSSTRSLGLSNSEHQWYNRVKDSASVGRQTAQER